VGAPRQEGSEIWTIPLGRATYTRRPQEEGPRVIRQEGDRQVTRFRLEPRRDVLLAVDLQNDFCAGGALAVPDGDAVVGPINRLSEVFAQVVATQDWHPLSHRSFASAHPGALPFEVLEMDYGQQVLWPDHCVQGTWGAEFHADFNLKPAQIVLRKGFRPEIASYSAFFENDRRTATGLGGYLTERGLKRLFICGLATDFCVFYSAMDGRKLGFEVVVLEDACRAIDLEHSLAAAKRQMLAAGIALTDSRALDLP